MTDFPNYSRWVDVLRRHDDGLLMVFLAAILAVIWLWNARFVFQRRLELMRQSMVLLFWLSFFAVIAFSLVEVS